MTAAQAVTAIAGRLAAAGITDARREARILLAAALAVDAAGLLLVADVDPAVFADIVARRAAREPMAYVLGRREFWGLEFRTSPAALIPRADSETLIEAALGACGARAGVRRVLDLGTGTGCLLLAALTEFESAFGVGVDRSAAAVALAAANATALGLAGRAGFLVGDWATALGGRFDLLFSNPPYIRGGEMAALMPDVRDFEPRLALDGGADGLAAYRRVIAALPRLLAPAGVAVLELGAGQAAAVAQLAGDEGFLMTTLKDLAGHERAAVMTCRK